MSEILPRHYLIAILLFGLVVGGGVAMLSEVRSVNPTFGESDDLAEFNDTFAIMDEAVSRTDSLEEDMKSLKTEQGLFGFLNSLIGGAWNTLVLLGDSFNFMDSVFDGLYTFFGIPVWVSTVIISIITVILVFALFSAIFQRDV